MIHHITILDFAGNGLILPLGKKSVSTEIGDIIPSTRGNAFVGAWDDAGCGDSGASFL